MKLAAGISIGSSKRNKVVEIELLNQKVRIERIGTDGDMEKAAQLFKEMDGKVDAFGVGGADLGLLVKDKWYPLYSVNSMIRFIQRTPVVDGSGLKITLEKLAAPVLEEKISAYLDKAGRSAFVITGSDRYGLLRSFVDARYQVVFGDLMFTLGLPFAVHSEKTIERLAALLMPVAGRLPFSWVYPVGEAQNKRTPRWVEHFQRATVIAGDCHYITRYMPDRLDGKVIVTNTTTLDDVEIFRQAGARYLLTTTPVLDGRSFGTNTMEAAFVAAMNWKTPIDYAHPGAYLRDLQSVLEQHHIRPQLQEL
ncbi:MAG TPA: hypothetical protein PKW33_14780 [Anaerolineaceae bacterium]|nr:hypothetical protein [Anaerolineaceae bacterium]HPN52856.1 hypothetical protein [Anaerolineaceae bacterium]